jgi:hypothetical protein
MATLTGNGTFVSSGSKLTEEPTGMEFRQKMSRVTTRPTPWIVAIVFVPVLGLIGWYSVPSSTPIQAASGHTPITSAQLRSDLRAWRLQKGQMSLDYSGYHHPLGTKPVLVPAGS